MCTIEFDLLNYMAVVVAQMNSARLRPTLYTIMKAWIFKECNKFSNTSNLIKRIVDNGRILDVGTDIFLKRNINVVNKYPLAHLHVPLGRWRSQQICFHVQTIGNSSCRGYLGTTATIITFLREEICQRQGVALLSKIEQFLLLFVQDITRLLPLLQLSNGYLVCKRFIVHSISLVLPPSAKGEVVIILILHMDVTDFTPKPFSVFHIYL